MASSPPLRAATLANALELRSANGALVPGTFSLITNLDGSQVIGLSFKPTGLLKEGATYTAVLKGGASGITALDGRQMAGNYSWTFIVRQHKIYTPIIRR